MIGAGLALVLLAVAAVQWRQVTVLERALQADEVEVMQLAQVAENDTLRLQLQWHRALDERVALEEAALRDALAEWVDRVDAVRRALSAASMQDRVNWSEALAEVDGFAARALRALDGAPADSARRAALADLSRELDALSPLLQGLSVQASLSANQQMLLRQDTVRQHNRTAMALTVFLSVLVLAFALIAGRQLGQLQQRRLRLEQSAARLRAAQQEAEAVNQAKSRFLADISHEIRTPFHALMGMLSLLRGTGLSPRQIDHLRTATESAEHLLALLNDILDMSQLESGRMALAPAAVDLRALITDVETLMRAQAGAKSLALHIDVQASLPSHVMVDATRLKQVLFNLLSNAIKFCERGSVLLDAHRGQADDGREEMVFVVTDTGIGMDEATVAGLFQRYARGDGVRPGGSGLGLEISRSLARLMSGDITVSTQPGRGSSFSLRLPLHAATAETLPTPPLPTAEGAPASVLHVLVAEDHPVNREYMAALLDSLGHRVRFAANGQEAVQAARDHAFDVVLMDLHMPLLDGIGATRAIRGLPDLRAATLPIVALTADALPDTRERCLGAGMNAFLSKPVSPEGLASCLRRLFGTDHAEPVAPPAALAAGSLPGASRLIDVVALDAALQAMPRERLAQMIHDYLDQAPHTAQRLRDAVRDAQPIDLREQAHAARGAALNLGLAGLARTAEALQEGATHLPAHEVARLVQHFDDLVAQTRSAILAAGFATAVPSSPESTGQPSAD